MLKRKISKSDYDAMADALKAEYKPNGDGYVLDTDDARELISARDAEKARADAVATELAATKKSLKDMTDANGDFTSIKASYEAKIATLTAENGTLNTTLSGERRDRFVGEAANKIAGRFSVPKLVTPEIAKRLDVDPRDGKTVRVLGTDGKPSALTLVDLEKEFVDNPEFKAIVVASKSSGSAVTDPHNRGSAPKSPTDKSVDLGSMSPQQFAAHRASLKDAETP